MISEWQPEPLVPSLDEKARKVLESIPTISGKIGTKIIVDGKQMDNLSSYNFIGAMGLDEINKKAVETMRNYGVGTCGPPGFYGTLDVHIDLENKIAKFLGVPAAILYSQNFAAVSSAIPAFAKRGDIIVVDEGVNFAVQKGVDISRANTFHFRHNSMEDLERVLRDVQKKFAKKPLTRRFIVVEGLYQNIGDVCPLPKLLELKRKYKYRLIVDETFSIGAIGSKGAGVSDHFSISANEIDIITGSFSHAFCSNGGFCAGSAEIVDHQRLSGQGYCFSASMPALMTVSASEAINYLEQNPSIMTRLRENVATIYKALKPISQLLIESDPVSPIIHLRIKGELSDEEDLLEAIKKECLKKGIFVVNARYVNHQELHQKKPSIRLSLSAGFSKNEIEKIASNLKSAVQSVLNK